MTRRIARSPGAAAALAALAALVIVVAPGCAQETRGGEAPPSATWSPPPVDHAPASSSSAATTPPRRPRPTGAPSREGETSVEALFERAREALLAGDDAAIVRCLAPAARRAWLADALLAIEVEAQDPRYQEDLARRRAVGALRDRVLSHTRRDAGPRERPRSLAATDVTDALLERVDDGDALLAELLAVARSLGHPLDPVGAVDRGRLGGAPPRPVAGEPPRADPAPAGLPRALRRIERSRELVEVHLEDGHGIALVRSPDGGLEPVRIVRTGDTLWVDES